MFPYWGTDSYKALEKEYNNEHSTGCCKTNKCNNTNKTKSLLDDDVFKRELFDILAPLTDTYSLKTTKSSFDNKYDTNYDMVEVKDDDGFVVANRIDLVIAPFRKDEVRVSVNPESGSITVTCDKTDKTDTDGNKSENCLFKGISHQTRSWTWDIPKGGIASGVKAKMDDGVLRITIPLEKDKSTNPDYYQIAID